MSFLDKVKNNTQVNSDNKLKPNPLKLNPLKKVNTENTEKKTVEAISEPVKKLNPLLAKKNPFGKPEEKKDDIITAEENDVSVIEVETKENVTTTSSTEIKIKSEPENSDVSKSEEKEEDKTEDTVEKSEEKSEKEDEKTTQKRTRRSKKSAAIKEDIKSDDCDVASDVSNTYADIPKTSISYDKAISSIKSQFVDKNWEKFRKEVSDKLANIYIEDDINPSTLKIAIAELSKLRQEIWSYHQDTKTLYEHLTSKEPEGTIERIKRINLGDGSNDLQRKKAGVEACMNFINEKGEKINIYEVLDETRERYNFLRAVMDSIQYKTNILITMNGALKLEKDHLAGEI